MRPPSPDPGGSNPPERAGLGATSYPAFLTPALVALVAFLPFFRGVLQGQSFYFRDLSLYYFPLRQFVSEGLRRGELRYWNPYVHEGIQELFPPISYPFDLLQALAPHEGWFSLLLALHVPLAALALFALARGLKLSPLAAAAGGLVYALGGYGLSALNLYDHLQALSWAPLVVLGLFRAARGGARSVSFAALFVAVVLSTCRVEIAAQAVVLGVLLSWRRGQPGQARRLAASLCLGAGLAAPTLITMWGLVAESARGQGLSTDVVLAHSVHPFTFLQVVVANLYGDLANVTDRWWGQNFFPRGFPYILSLYLGIPVLSLAVTGARHGRILRVRLLLIALLAGYLCLGRWGGLAPVVEALPFLRSFRYPTKAFFSVHFAVALLAALGLDALITAPARNVWRGTARVALVFGPVLACLSAFPWFFAGPTRWFLASFFPPGFTDLERASFLRLMIEDALTAALLACTAGAIALLVALHRTPRRGAPLALTAIVVVDLLRAGAGLNPMVTRSFFEISPEMLREAGRIQREGARLFTCDVSDSAPYLEARKALRGRHETWTFATLMETLTPYLNVRHGIRTARSIDLTMLVPTERVASVEEARCGDLARNVGKLQRAGVEHVISLTPLRHPELSLETVVTPRRIDPLGVYVYRLGGAFPMRFVAREVHRVPDQNAAIAFTQDVSFRRDGVVAVEGAGERTFEAEGRILRWREAPGRIEVDIAANRPTVFMNREAYARGWAAWVDSVPTPVLRADGFYTAVPVPAGTSQVVLRYSPPGLREGLTLSLISLLLAVALGVRRRQPPPKPDTAAQGRGTATAV